MSVSLVEPVILDDDAVQIQEGRWKQAIKDLDRVMPLWHYHATRLNLTMERSWCPTAAVDGVKLYWNPEFTARLSDKELLFLLAHEVFHVANGHIWRGERYQKGLEGQELREVSQRLNAAADYAIHQVLVPLLRSKKKEHRAYKKMKFPTGKNRGLYDRRFWNMSMERIYEFLLAHPDDKANAKKQSLDVHIFRGIGDSGDAPEGAVVDKDGNWVLVVDKDGKPIDVPQEAKDAGTAPKPMNSKRLRVSIKRDLNAQVSGEEAGKGKGTKNLVAMPQVDKAKDDWSMLTQFVTMNASADYSYSRPNRSYLSRRLIVPGLRSGTINIVIVIDTSGSVKQDGLNLFASNIELIRKQLGDHTLTLIFCDDEIQGDVDVYDANQDVVWSTRGGGGTNFKPPFKWVEDNMTDPPSCLVYFTDGLCSGARPEAAPGYPVLWALWGKKQQQPWGVNLPLTDL
jgi:predicted metal-dependent peptidase